LKNPFRSGELHEVRFRFNSARANGQSVAKGDKLIAAAAGEVQEYPASPALGDEEKIIGVAEETVDASGGALPIMVRLR